MLSSVLIYVKKCREYFYINVIKITLLYLNEYWGRYRINIVIRAA